MKGRVWRRIVNRVRSPEFVTTGIQVLKSTIAATAAWWLAVAVFETELPFLAPWTALLTVHATVYRSLSRGLQTMVASAVGIGLSFVIGAYLGVTLWTFGLALLVGLWLPVCAGSGTRAWPSPPPPSSCSVVASASRLPCSTIVCSRWPSGWLSAWW
ncbi:FUSC family protein [Sanguibacter sp. Z1732]|uniref:FUSC family protein n=1 Tax=Sanguibacter sp. Z1732 TaxID=3435412 RepID=UPI003D9C9CEF